MAAIVNGPKPQSNGPLDTLKLPFEEDGVTKFIPALDKKWVKEHCFLPFCQLPEKNADGSFVIGARETWLDHARMFCKDMKWLLKLKQHEFWSQMVYDNCAMAALVSFLQEALPCYALDKFPKDDKMWEVYEEIHVFVLLVMKRLATHKESKTSYMTPKLHGELLYDNYLFTIPILMDLCLLYGQNNRSLLLHIFNAIFSVQSKYAEDLKKSVEFITQALHGVGKCAGVNVPSGADPERIPQHKECLTADALQDLIIHVLDTSYSISFLLDIFSPACRIFHQEGFELVIVWFYENVFPELYSKLETYVNEPENSTLFTRLKNNLDVARVEFIKSFRYMLFTNINMTIEKRDNLPEADILSCVDDYVNIMTECLSERLFICDYHHMFNVGMDLDVLAQLSPDMDSEKRTYILEGVIGCLDNPVIPPSPVANSFKSEQASSGDMTSSKIKDQLTEESFENAENSTKQKVSGVKLESLITQVKDILPHLGDGFVEKCLEHYNYVSESVINAVLEGKLPLELQHLSPTLARPEAKESANVLETSSISDDETKMPVYVEAHKGKRKSVYRDMLMMINDKSHREDCRDFYTQQNLYEDDYDDTYDDRLDVSFADDEDPESKQTWYSQNQKTRTVESSSDEDSGDENTATVPPDQFVPNPEILRAKQEQRTFARTRNDVVGRPKGHGQEKNVLINRSYKTANKSKRANHNRRFGAQKKRQQGMVPS